MNKKNKIFNGIVIAFVVVIIGALSYSTVTANNDAPKAKKTIERHADDLVIETVEPCTEGVVEVFKKDGETIYFEAGGTIEIINDGKNGEPIRIRMQTLAE